MTSKVTRRIRINGKDFLLAGLNVTDNQLLVPPNEMVDADNILVGSTLARKKRSGQAYFCTDASDEGATYPTNPLNNSGNDGDPILGVYEFLRYTASGTESDLVVRQGTKVWAISGRTGAATDITGALVLPSGGRITFQTFEGVLYWVGTGSGGTPEGYNKWTGSGNATAITGGVTLPPDGTPQFILAHGGRMWAWGVPDYPYRLYYSEFYDAETWATAVYGATGTAAEAGSLDLDPFGDPIGINGGVSFQDRLYIFMRRARFEITGNTINNFVVKTVSKKIGCVGHHTIVVVGDEVVYASERGPELLMSSDKAIESVNTPISKKIKRIWNEGLDRARYLQFSACFDEQEGLYLLSAPSLGSTANDVILAYNLDAQVWSGVWSGHKARCLTNYLVSGVNKVLAGREDGVLSLLGESTLTDLGEPFTARFKTGMLFPGEEIDIQHVWKSVTLLASSLGNGSLVINAYVDGRLVKTHTLNLTPGSDVLGSTFILGESVLSGGSFVPRTFSVEGQGYGLQLEVIFNTTNEVEVYGFIVEAVPAGTPIGGRG